MHVPAGLRVLAVGAGLLLVSAPAVGICGPTSGLGALLFWSGLGGVAGGALLTLLWLTARIAR